MRPAKSTEHGVAERDADDGERRDQVAAALHADEQRDPDEADRDADEPRPVDALAWRRSETASSTVKIGAAAWITAVSPESSRVSAKPSSQNGNALLSAPRTTSGTTCPAERRRARRGRATARGADEHADHEPAEHDDRRLELVDAELDEQERRSPDRGEQQQQEGVAAGHARRRVNAAAQRTRVRSAGRLRRRASSGAALH